MSVNHTKAVFDASASTYDADRSKLIPGCDAFYRWAVDLIPERAKNILDLGAGSGLLTMLVRRRFPDAHIRAIDFSGPMLELARARLGDDLQGSILSPTKSRARWSGRTCGLIWRRIADFTTPSLPRPETRFSRRP